MVAVPSGHWKSMIVDRRHRAHDAIVPALADDADDCGRGPRGDAIWKLALARMTALALTVPITLPITVAITVAGTITLPVTVAIAGVLHAQWRRLLGTPEREPEDRGEQQCEQ
jgi:hypothetical protein